MVASSPSSVEASTSPSMAASSSSPSMEASSSPSMEASLRSHGAYSTSGMGSSCCPPVFDPYTLIGLIGGIALATYFLRLVIVVEQFGRSFPFNLNFGSGLSGNVGEFECIFIERFLLHVSWCLFVFGFIISLMNDD